SLSLNPAQPDIFNLLGVYFTQVGEFDAAYESFDSTLELDPANSYAERNRSIALYYGERYDLANEEM
ncbi:lipoprotein NlpI, partial [Vibrio sp. 10N.222.55.F8]